MVQAGLDKNIQYLTICRCQLSQVRRREVVEAQLKVSGWMRMAWFFLLLLNTIRFILEKTSLQFV